MPDPEPFICFKCGNAIPVGRLGCGCVRQCGCIFLQDGFRVLCADCATAYAGAESESLVAVGDGITDDTEAIKAGSPMLPGTVWVNAPEGSGDAESA